MTVYLIYTVKFIDSKSKRSLYEGQLCTHFLKSSETFQYMLQSQQEAWSYYLTKQQPGA